MPRLLLLTAGLLLATSAALLAAGCLDDMAEVLPGSSNGAAPGPRDPGWAVASAKDVPPDLAPAPDLTPPPPPDLAPADLTGLVNCYNKAYCDAATMFCLRFIGGSPGKPEPEKVAPSCYTPNDPCANNTLDCACIQADPVLGPSCAECFDNKDGTFTCYAQ
jgi:hypothetical protein